jgi:hypothetical protein
MKSLSKLTLCIVAFVLLTFLTNTSVNAQTIKISPYLIGNNAWYYVNLKSLWGKIDTADFQTIRIGGAGAEGWYGDNAWYMTLIDDIRKANAEPIVQVPRYLTDQQVIDFITKVNITNNKKIKLWSIGNEPDHRNRPSPVNEVSAYIKRISSALKSVDSTIIVMGPDNAGYWNYLNDLLGTDSLSITGKNAAGHYYIDVYTWHRYMFNTINGLESDVNNMMTRLATINASRPEGKKLTWGLTEFNSTYDNAKNPSSDYDVWNSNTGQVYAEVYGLGMRKNTFTMTAWSMLEGDSERAGTDLSLFDKDHKGRSNYYHSLMLGQNMKNFYVTPTDNQDSVVVIPMKDSTGIAVMILNKDRDQGFDYALRLDDNNFTNNKALQIKVNAGKNIELTDSITKFSTQMLIFDNQGILKKKYSYTSVDADFRGEPLIQYISNDPVPFVSLTTPKSNAEFKVRTPVTLSATATDNGTISKVEFTVNGALIGTSKTAPYTFTWIPKTEGTYTISARAFDNLGGVGFSKEKQRVTIIASYTLIPAKIEAEDYKSMLGIQNQVSSDEGGGQNIAYTDVNDWLEYLIDVPKTGLYNFEMRLASLSTTGSFQIKKDTTVLTTFTLPNGSGGWQNWTTVSKPVSLSAGQQKIKLLITGKGLNINWMNITSKSK